MRQILEIPKESPQKPNNSYKVSCNHCNCLFLYQDEDVLSYGDGHSYVQCPYCHKHVMHFRSNYHSNDSIMHG